MKKIIIALFLFVSIKSIAQEKEFNFYNFKGNLIKYSRVDYSKYGIQNFFVTMYAESKSTKLIQENAEKFLRKQERLYHTLYFFIEIPRFYGQEDKESIFNGIMKGIEKKEKLKDYSIYLNFDVDYSQKYQTELAENGLKNTIDRIFLDVNEVNIVEGL